MPNDKTNEKEVIAELNQALELELAGVVRYTHYSLMIFGHSRIPLVASMRAQATESLLHATQIGEHITALGGHPSLKIGRLLETHKHDIDQILRECIEHEREALACYRRIWELVKDKSIVLEEFARQMLHNEELHVSEVEKMMRAPGDLGKIR